MSVPQRIRLLEILERSPASTIELSRCLGIRRDQTRRLLRDYAQLGVVSAVGQVPATPGHHTKVWALAPSQPQGETA